MVVKISYFIIFGIITFTTAKPARDDREDSDFSYVKNEYELQKLLQSLVNQYNIASNYREDGANAYDENRAGSSRYDNKPRQSYYHNDKTDALQYYKSRENANENQPNFNSLQIINQLLEKNDDKPGYDNGQNLLEDLLSMNRNNKLKLLKPNDETDNVDEIVTFLDDLQKKVADDRNNRDDYVNGKTISDDNLSGKLFLGENDKQEVSDQVESEKDGVMKLVENIFGYKSRYHEPEYVSVIDSSSDRDNLRCSGKNCARTNNAVNNDNNNRLRCRGKNCARSRIDDNDDLKYNTKLSVQKVKLNDEVDAVVLGLSDVEHLLSKLNVPKQARTNKLRGAKLLENVDLDSLLNSKGNIGKRGNVEAVVFDLTQVENSNTVARQIKQLLSQNNEGSYDEYEEYGNLVEEQLKKGVYDIGQQFSAGRANSQILPHNENNNNVYLPQWLLDELIEKSYGEKEVKEPEKKRKSLFPLTRQQKERMEQKRKEKNTPRIYRRNLDQQDVGVPFHLEVQGLGQVNP